MRPAPYSIRPDLGRGFLLPPPLASSASLELTADEHRSLLRIAAGALPIQRHYDLFVWLHGELQRLLPHETLIAGWGDFAAGRVQLDVVSSVPAVHMRKDGCCEHELMRRAHARWMRTGGQPLVLEGDRLGNAADACACAFHEAWHTARSLLVHGVRDERARSESVYVVLSTAGFAAARAPARFNALAHLLVCQIDVAFRQVTHYAPQPNLSARERQILDLICRGGANREIAAELQISLFTVKNHVQRLFRKLGVRSRTQAARNSIRQ